MLDRRKLIATLQRHVTPPAVRPFPIDLGLAAGLFCAWLAMCGYDPLVAAATDADWDTEYRDAIALADHQVGMLVDAISARPTYPDEDWLILISTDHGRRPDGGHGGDSPEEMTIFILASGPATATWPPPGPAGIVDIAATALDHLGIAIDLAWGLDGMPLGTRGGQA